MIVEFLSQFNWNDNRMTNHQMKVKEKVKRYRNRLKTCFFLSVVVVVSVVATPSCLMRHSWWRNRTDDLISSVATKDGGVLPLLTSQLPVVTHAAAVAHCCLEMFTTAARGRFHPNGFQRLFRSFFKLFYLVKVCSSSMSVWCVRLVWIRLKCMYVYMGIKGTTKRQQ